MAKYLDYAGLQRYNDIVNRKIESILPEATASGNPISIDNASGFNAKSAKVTMLPIQSGSGDPSPENVRPISGRDNVKLVRTGKNLFDVDSVTVSDITFENDVDHTTTTRKGFFYNLPAGTWTLKGNSASIQTYVYVNVLSSTGAFKSNVRLSTTSSAGWNARTITLEEGDYLAIYEAVSTETLDKNFMLQIELGSTATAYEPYNGQTYTATFPSTVYGVEYEFVEGGLTDELVLFTATEAFLYGNFGVDNAPLYYIDIPEGISIKQRPSTGYDGHLYSNYFVETVASGATYLADGECRTNAGTPNRIYFRWDSAENLSAINTAFATTPLQIVGARTTPTTTTLTPQSIALNKGNNVLTTDGDNAELKYSVSLDSLLPT